MSQPTTNQVIQQIQKYLIEVANAATDADEDVVRIYYAKGTIYSRIKKKTYILSQTVSTHELAAVSELIHNVAKCSGFIHTATFMPTDKTGEPAFPAMTVLSPLHMGKHTRID